ncbi:MAG: CvpA family protein [Candidatus Fibromonas sp.]|jgi:membrane protein required for colicin V production|nr:CvpA family protein [Candidatus Fibromonas sp.]
MFIDVIVFLLVIIFAAIGIAQGFVVSVLYLAAWVAGIISAWLFAGAFASMLNANIEGLPHLLTLCLGALIAFLLPFILLRFAAYIAKIFIKKSSTISKINRILGGVFGMLKGMAMSAVILTIIHFLPAQGGLKQAKENSISYLIYEKIHFASLWKEFKIEKKLVTENEQWIM